MQIEKHYWSANPIEVHSHGKKKDFVCKIPEMSGRSVTLSAWPHLSSSSDCPRSCSANPQSATRPSTASLLINCYSTRQGPPPQCSLHLLTVQEGPGRRCTLCRRGKKHPVAAISHSRPLRELSAARNSVSLIPR